MAIDLTLCVSVLAALVAVAALVLVLMKMREKFYPSNIYGHQKPRYNEQSCINECMNLGHNYQTCDANCSVLGGEGRLSDCLEDHDYRYCYKAMFGA